MLLGDPDALKQLESQRATIPADEYESRRAAILPQLAEGDRNNVFFEAATYLKRKYESEDQAVNILTNLNSVAGFGLTATEITKTTRSAFRKAYSYRCDKPWIKRACDRKLCLTREFGIKLTLGDEVVAFSDFAKFTSDPPRYVITADGCAVTMSGRELLNLNMFNERIFDATGKLVSRTAKQHAEWCVSLRERMRKCDPPSGSDLRSTIRDMLFLFFDEAAELKGDDERFFLGRVLTRGDDHWFQLRHFKKFLQRDGLRPKPAEITDALKSLGCSTMKTNIAGKSAEPWIVSRAELNDA